MQQDLLFYDRQGFVPSDDRLTLEGYVRESAGKLALRQRFEEDPSGFVSRQIGREVEGELLRADEETSRRFRETFVTEPFPGFSCLLSVYKDVRRHHSPLSRITHLAALSSGGSSGTILRFTEGRTELPLPILKRSKISDTELSSNLGHETIHTVREQVFRSRGMYRGLGVEEVVAHLWQIEEDNEQLLYLLQKLCGRFSLNYYLFSKTPLYGIVLGTAAAVVVGTAPPGEGLNLLLASLAGGAVPYSISLGLTYRHALQTASFFKQCASEGITPGYVYLRSSPGEFSSNKTIQEQLATSENIRFQIMAYQLGLKR